MRSLARPGERIRKLRERLLIWYRRHQRVLPWRSRRTPYRIWIAEIMLQQTRVQTVLTYYSRFLQRFPDVATLAAASEEDVLELWAGLGYYRRARQLHAAAKKIVTESGGRFPRTFEGILQLPGVGRYTAGAIHSIAFDQPQPVVDGNVIRVITRFNAISKAPAGYFWSQAELWLDRDAPADFNQAVMELGALLCLPVQPRCTECPVKSLCRSGRRGTAAPTQKRPERAQESVELVMLILKCGRNVVLEKLPEDGFIPGAWGLPVRILRPGSRPMVQARNLARVIFGTAPPLEESGSVRHAITHRSIVAHLFKATPVAKSARLLDADRFAWFPQAGLNRLLTSSLFRKGLKIR
jgi:A/G-specific adenine glycosylase